MKLMDETKEITEIATLKDLKVGDVFKLETESNSTWRNAYLVIKDDFEFAPKEDNSLILCLNLNHCLIKFIDRDTPVSVFDGTMELTNLKIQAAKMA